MKKHCKRDYERAFYLVFQNLFFSLSLECTYKMLSHLKKESLLKKNWQQDQGKTEKQIWSSAYNILSDALR